MKKPRRGIPPKALAQALQTLEVSALQNMQDFGAQEIANTLHIMAKQRHKVTDTRMLALERRAETISGEFKPQNVANTLWAYETMGTKPGDWMMGQLERRAEARSGEFNSQNVANMLWAFATMGTRPGERMMGQLERRAETISGEFQSQDVANILWSNCFFCMLSSDLDCGFVSSLISVASRLDSQCFGGLDSQHLRQVHQFFIACDIEESLGMRLPASIYALKADLGPACKAAFLAAPAHPSASQQQVSDTLRDMGLSVDDEFRCPKSGYSIDMRVQDKCPQGTSTSVDFGVGWATEFDGPWHFLACKAPTGATLIKWRHLELLGYNLVSVTYWEWGGLSGMDERRKYLEGKLLCDVGVDSAAHS
jgi:hypothetical protein